MSFLRMAALLLATAFAAPGFAQSQSTDNMQILLDKIKADKKLLVANNMNLTDAEAKGFWPIYDQYQQQLGAINKRLGDLILQYADAYKNNSLTDDTAKALVDKLIAIQGDEVQIKKSFVPKLANVLPMKKVARYLQIENKIRAAVNYELAAQVPLVE